MLDENFKTLQELGDEISPSVSEEEKTKINSLLDELRTSLQTLKQRISGKTLNGNVHIGEAVDAKGLTGVTRDSEDLGVHACYSMENEENDSHVVTMNFRFSDDSDEEQRRIKGSSDGSQYGSDSGMGDSLMNTLASECIDGVSKTPTGSPENNIAQRELDVEEMNSSEGTICCDRSPVNERDIDGLLMAAECITQTKPGSECEANKHASHVIDHTVQPEKPETVLPPDFTTDKFKRTGLRFEDKVPNDSSLPVDHFAKNTLLVSDQDTLENARGNIARVAEDSAGLNSIVHSLTPAHREGSMAVSKYSGQVMIADQESDTGSLEYISLPEANLDNNSQNEIGIAKSKSRTMPQKDPELEDQVNTDSGPFIPVEFLLPDRTSTKKTLSNQQNELFEETSREIPSSEQTPSEDSAEVEFLQKSRVHDIDEELLLRNAVLQNNETDGRMGEGQGFVNGAEYPLVSSVPPPMKTVEEFVEEPDALFQRLVDIEVMLKPQENDEDNLKSALLKHVVSKRLVAVC